MAVVVNTSNYYVLAFASPLTYQIIGHVKTIIIIISGFLIFKNDFTLRILVGIILALIGVILYTEENRQQMIARQKLVPVVTSLNK
jgi:solute carrier family 35 protein E3